MSDIIEGAFPPRGSKRQRRTIPENTLRRMLGHQPAFELGRSPNSVTPLLCTILPDMIEELLEHRQRSRAVGIMSGELPDAIDAALAAEGLVRELLAEMSNVQGEQETDAARLLEVETALLQLATLEKAETSAATYQTSVAAAVFATSA